MVIRDPIYRRDGIIIRASASQSVDLGFISIVKLYLKTLKNIIHSFPAWRSAQKRIVWRASSLVLPG